jgi:hypothetical protein
MKLNTPIPAKTGSGNTAGSSLAGGGRGGGKGRTGDTWQTAASSMVTCSTKQTTATPDKRPQAIYRTHAPCPHFSRVLKLTTAFRRPGAEAERRQALSSPPRVPPPGTPRRQTHRVCPHTFTISFKEGFRYLVVLHRGQPWSSMASPLLLTSPRRLFQPQPPASTPGHDANQVPTNRPGRSLRKRAPARSEALRHKRSGSAFSGPAPGARS